MKKLDIFGSLSTPEIIYIKKCPHRAFFIYLTNKVLLYAFLRNRAFSRLNSPHVIIHCSGG